MTIDSPRKTLEFQSAEELVHDRQLCQARFSPCGKFLLAAGYDRQVHRWTKADDGTFKGTMSAFDGHDGWVQSVAFALDGGHVFSADSWGRLSCWLYAEESPEPVWSHPAALAGWIRCLTVSPDGKSVAAAGNDHVVRIWSTSDGSLQQELPDHSDDVFSVCYHPNGQALVTGDWKGTVRHWDLETGKVVRQFDGSSLYQLHRIQDCGGARVLAFDAQGTRLVCGGQKDAQGSFATGTPAVLLFDWESGELQQQLEVGTKDEGFVYDALFHPSGFLLTVACAMPKKGRLATWEPGEAEALYPDNNIVNCRSLSLHPDGQLLAVVVSESANRNGRPEKKDEYPGGSGKIHILKVI